MTDGVESIGDRIRMARSAKGLGQEELARNAGVTQQQISDWEGGTMPTTKNVQKLLRALDVSGRWLLLGEGAMEPTKPEQIDLARVGRLVDEVRRALRGAPTDVPQ